MKVGLALVGILLVAATSPTGAGERMILKVTPAVAFAPANLVVRAIVESDADNRAIAVVAESEDFYRSSEIQLDDMNTIIIQQGCRNIGTRFLKNRGRKQIGIMIFNRDIQRELS